MNQPKFTERINFRTFHNEREDRKDGGLKKDSKSGYRIVPCFIVGRPNIVVLMQLCSGRLAYSVQKLLVEETTGFFLVKGTS